MVKSVRLAILAATLIVAGCGGSDDDEGSSATKSSANEPVTIEWWHISNNDPMKSIWADAATQYTPVATCPPP